MSVTAVHLIIHGRVQGVGFRSWTLKTAIRCALTGWVRNRREGTVEAVFCGDYMMLELMKAHGQHGPEDARIKYIETKPWDGEIPEDFRTLPTV